MPCYSGLISKKKEVSSELSYLTAQSGSDGLADNSMEFVVFFCDKQDISAIKVDVRMNKEHQLVLHQKHWKRGKYYVALEDVFAYIAREKSPIRINCDLKETGLEEAVYGLADKYALWPQVELSGTVACRYLSKWSNQILLNIQFGMDDSFHGEISGDGEKCVARSVGQFGPQPSESHQHQSSVVHGCRTGKRQAVEIGIFLWIVNELSYRKL